MSIYSDMSEASIMMGDTEINAGEYLDETFKSIQSHINDLHAQARMMLMADDRNEDYEECLEYYKAIVHHVKEACIVFKDLPKAVKQLMPPKPRGYVDPTETTLGAVPE